MAGADDGGLFEDILDGNDFFDVGHKNGLTILEGIGANSGSTVASVIDRFGALPTGVNLVAYAPGSTTPLLPGAPVGTGTVLQLVDAQGNVLDSITVVVMGDLTGNGASSVADGVRLLNAIGGGAPLVGAFFLAADMDGNGSLTVPDAVRLLNAIA
jgi:hypothetical protein